MSAYSELFFATLLWCFLIFYYFEIWSEAEEFSTFENLKLKRCNNYFIDVKIQLYQQINQIHVDTESGQNLSVSQPDFTLGIAHGRIVSGSLMK